MNKIWAISIIIAITLSHHILASDIQVEPEPPIPTVDNPIRLSREYVVTYSDSTAVIKIAILNPTSNEINLTPELVCEDYIIAKFLKGKKPIGPNSSEVYTGVLQFQNAPIGKGSCKIIAEIDGQINEKDVVIDIREAKKDQKPGKLLYFGGFVFVVLVIIFMIIRHYRKK